MDKAAVVDLYEASTVARKLDGWDSKVHLLGDPLSSTFEKDHLTTIKVPGEWVDGKQEVSIRINKALASLFLTVFQAIQDLKLGYTLKYSGAYAFRYNTAKMKRLNGRSEYADISSGDLRFSYAEEDRKNGRFDDVVKWLDKKNKEHSEPKKSMLSNHAFGSAIDLNSSTNPMGSGLEFDMPKEIVQVFAKYGFDWGGYYHDYMHFEYMLDHILGSANVPVAPPEAAPKTPPQNTGPRTTPPPPGKPSAPIPAASVKSLIPGMEFSKDWLERQWQQYQDKKREEEVEEAHDSIQSDSGYFPIGLNLTWHGGIHCRASSDGSVHAMTDGVVVAVRLPDKDPVKLSYGSRNFVLVKHKTPLGKPFWTLYMHLRPVLLKPDDPHMPSVFPWLLKRSLTRVGEGTSNLRKTPDAEQGEVLRELDPGETFDVLDDRTVGAQKWFFVQAKKDDSTGWVALTSKFELKSEIPGLEDIKAGKVVKLSAPVKRGDCLGFISPAPAGKTPFLHWEVFSDGVVSDKWIQVKDDDALKNDIICDSVQFKQILNRSQVVTFFHPLNKDNIREAYRDPKTAAQIRSRTFFFKSEWAVVWDTALDRLKNDYDVEDLAPRLQLYNFWKDAETLGCDLPKGGSVWHYHPTEFMAREFPVPKAEPAADAQSDGDEIETYWPRDSRNLEGQNNFNDLILEASKKYSMDPLLLKSLIAQESAFNPKAHNNVGYAGLTQIGGAAISEAGLSKGATKKVDGIYNYDMVNDERFIPRKSIFAGALIFTRKRKTIDSLVFSKYLTPLDPKEKEKFYVAAYNAGEGTIQKAFKGSGTDNPTWDDLIEGEEKSYLWEAIPTSWGRQDKYREITRYVSDILARRYK
jgi:hypothetical protein